MVNLNDDSGFLSESSNRSENLASDLDVSIPYSFDESSLDASSQIPYQDPESSFEAQQFLYGPIRTAPEKSTKAIKDLPKITGKLVIPKQRKRPASIASSETRKNSTKLIAKATSSTCGKEGIRNFSSPAPLRVSLKDTAIPDLSPPSYNPSTEPDYHQSHNASVTDISICTPYTETNKYTSPLSVRSFSTPLADLRASKNAANIQIKLNQLSSDEYLEELERSLVREVSKYQLEIDLMKGLKKQRSSKNLQKLDNLIVKWRDVAKTASALLLGEAKHNIEAIGGMTEYRKRAKESKLRKRKFEFDENMLYRIEEYMQTEEYKSLDEHRKDEVKTRRKELEAISQKLENGEVSSDEADASGEDDDLTMKELYRQMRLDYHLVYGDT